MEDKLSLLTVQVAELLEELRAVRKENAALRRQVEALRGLQQHQPYASARPQPLPSLPSPRFSPLPAVPRSEDPEAFLPLTVRVVEPGRSRTAAGLSPDRVDLQDAQGETVMESPPAAADSKRARRSLEEPLAHV